MTGASGGAILNPWLTIPTQLVKRDPCHNNILNEPSEDTSCINVVMRLLCIQLNVLLIMGDWLDASKMVAQYDAEGIRSRMSWHWKRSTALREMATTTMMMMMMIMVMMMMMVVVMMIMMMAGRAPSGKYLRCSVVFVVVFLFYYILFLPVNSLH